VRTFVLSGLSKVAALPQMKASWIVCFAADLERLEVIPDTFLSMSAPIQHALPIWLSKRAEIHGQIKQRLDGNLERLDEILQRQTLVTRLKVEAGWYAVLRVPEVQPEEQMILDLLSQRAVVVHPGSFFGFSGQGWLVVSLLAPIEEFAAGIAGICLHFNVQT
jgi:alanine-synthesizing transaminase